MKTKLFDQISDKLKAFAVPDHQMEIFDASFISVDARENNIVSGGVKCIMCNAENEQQQKIKPITVYCRNKSGHLSWVISNFITHLKRTHALVESHKEKKLCQSNDERYSGLNETENISISSELMNMDFESEPNGMGSDEKKLNDEISKQLIKMWNVATLHGEKIKYGLTCIDSNTEPVSFDVVEIPANGDCMLSTAAHQLFGKDLSSREHELATESLRSDIVKYINDHYDDFQFDVRGHVYELKEIADKDPDRDQYNIRAIDDIEEACKYFINQCLVKPGCWCGAESLKAIHFLHNVDIILLNENDIISYQNGSNVQIRRTIILAYRVSADPTVRNHYDSVCNMTPDAIYRTSKKIAAKLNQSNNSTINLDTSQFNQ